MTPEPATPCPFMRRRCPNPRCHARVEHAQQHVWVQHPGEPASWLPVIGWCCSLCGHVHVDGPAVEGTPAPLLLMVEAEKKIQALHARAERAERERDEALSFVPMPEGIHLYNGSGTPCDMLVGPCSCGATHDAIGWARHAASAARTERERDELGRAAYLLSSAWVRNDEPSDALIAAQNLALAYREPKPSAEGGS